MKENEWTDSKGVSGGVDNSGGGRAGHVSGAREWGENRAVSPEAD
jgi:hypothetical protein